MTEDIRAAAATSLAEVEKVTAVILAEPGREIVPLEAASAPVAEDIRKRMAELDMSNTQSVSYTHLDVYKRQPEGDRIAKVLSRAGVASRREAERMIELGEVAVNGKVITSPALNVTAKDKITVRGELVREPEQARLWLYYKPEGLVTSESDEKGRETVFENLPEDLPRVMSVGRLDLNSEGLLLLTNDLSLIHI